MKYDLKFHIRSNKAFYVYLFSLNNSSVKPTLPLCFPKIVCALLSPIPTKREGGRFPFCSLDVETQSSGEVAWFLKNVLNFWSNNNLELGSYGQLLSLFSLNFSPRGRFVLFNLQIIKKSINCGDWTVDMIDIAIQLIRSFWSHKLH